MTASTLSLLVSFLAATSLATRSSPLIKRKTPTAFTDPSPDVESPHYATLKAGGPSRSSKHLASSRKAAKDATTSASAQLTGILDGTEFIVPVKIFNEDFQLVVDTGSSDTWVMKKGFQCLNVTEVGYYDYEFNDVPESACGFGNLYTGGFEGGQIAKENFNVSYGSGEFVIGDVGHSHVTVAGLTVVHQEIALGTEAYFEGDGISSGILGLAYEALTSAFKGTNAEDDSASNSAEYSPFFQTLYTQGLSTPIFSLALQRTASTAYTAPEGYIAFGGYPPVSFTPTFTSTPIEIVQLSSANNQATKVYSYYAIYPDGFVGGPASSKVRRQHGGGRGGGGNEQVPFIVDSGTTLIYAPSELTAEIAAIYNPPAYYFEEYGLYFAECTATPPTLGVQINGTDFYINPADLIIQSEGFQDEGYNFCLAGVQDGGDGPFILGDVFLKNVVAVFDVGAAEMRFAVHDY